ncbi:MAG: histidine kinase [Flavobacteriaceae bacterium]
MVIGTNRGIYLHNDKESVHLINTDYHTVLKIIVKGNILWLATQKGVLKIAINADDLSNSKVIQTLNEADGLLQNNTNDIYLEGDNLYVTSDNGLSKINTAKSLNDKAPNLYFKTSNDTLTILPKADKNISVTFGVLDFVNQDNITYEYRLLPNQKKWTSTESKALNFTNLNPITHVLEVKASNQHLKQSVVKQYIQVLPFWWQTRWAKTIFLLLFLLCVAFIMWYFFARFKKKETRKMTHEKIVANLELQALRSQMNPHFVHNSLNAIQYYIQRNEVNLSEDYLEKFSKLIRLFFENASKQFIPLNDEIEMLRYYLEIEKLRFEDKLSFELIIDDKIDIETQNIPAMLLQPIVENAVNHGLFHKLTKGMITINFIYIAEKEFTVIIKDDGVGTIRAAEIYKKSKRNYRSKSSEVLKERLHLLEKSKKWHIKYNIKDLSVSDNSNGTIVSLNFKEIK